LATQQRQTHVIEPTGHRNQIHPGGRDPRSENRNHRRTRPSKASTTGTAEVRAD
jgi:hypothetical protein